MGDSVTPHPRPGLAITSAPARPVPWRGAAERCGEPPLAELGVADCR